MFRRTSTGFGCDGPVSEDQKCQKNALIAKIKVEAIVRRQAEQSITMRVGSGEHQQKLREMCGGEWVQVWLHEETSQPQPTPRTCGGRFFFEV
jgi:hypothetical protein